jgi:maltose/moltooligosaccharide transporter
MSDEVKDTKQASLPNLNLKTIWMLSFAFFGVQMGFSLQSSNLGRLLQTLGADPHSLGWFFILPPLAGLFVQPIIGRMSDRTWNRFGRRMPYLIVGTVVSAIVMFLLPNAGNLGFKATIALIFGAITIMFMDTSFNVAMQPIKMVVGDTVNEEQKGYAYAVQSFLANAGSVLASIFPFALTAFGVANTAKPGVIPDSVAISFYVGAVILVITTVIALFSVKEYSPEEYARYHGIDQNSDEPREGVLSLLIHAPKIFWALALVQFFSWFGFQYLWTYGTGAIADTVWHTENAASHGYQAAGNWFGVLSAIQSIGAVLWSLVLTRVHPNKQRFAYAGSLAMGAVGFISILFISDQWTLIVSFLLIGASWSAILAYPFTFLTNALDGKNNGTYLGLFNGAITIPQIVASVASFGLFPLLGSSMPHMLFLAGISLLLSAIAVGLLKKFQ